MADRPRASCYVKEDECHKLEEKKYLSTGKDDLTNTGNCWLRGKRYVPERAAEAIFDDMVSFMSMLFNKSHAAACAVVSYETATSRRTHPVEFMAVKCDG